MPVVAVVNQKGGVGKTTVSLGLAGAATARGLSTLVVDLDPQANATTGLGIFDDDLPTIADALDPDSDEPIERVVTASSWPADRAAVPDLTPGSPELTIAERHLGDDPLGAQDRLASLLAPLRHELVIIDCPPSVGLLTINALFAADQALVVTEPAAWSHDAVAQVLDTIARVGARRRGSPMVSAVVINKLGRTRDNRYWATQIADAVEPTPSPAVRLRAAVGEAAAQSLPVDALGRRSGVAEARAELDTLLELVLASATPPQRAR